MRRLFTVVAVLCTCFMLTAPCYSQVPAATGTTGNDDWNKNWILVKSYDPSGNVIGESKQFFDNSGQLQQNQSKLKYRKDPNTVYTHVLATQPILDAYGRPAASTMGAPINSSEFIYKPDFVQNTSGTTYDYRNFDRYKPSTTETDKTSNPDAVGQNNIGTLGWYYSNNNNWEPYTPTTSYPYSRQTYYQDGTGNVKKTGGVGEAYKMGSGHEVSSYVTPVGGELNHYVTVRNKFFAPTTSLKENAIQMVSRDANGKMGAVIQDKGGKTLMTARAIGGDAGDMKIETEFSLGRTSTMYSFDLGSFTNYQYVKDIEVIGAGTIQVTDWSWGWGDLAYTGPASVLTNMTAGSFSNFILFSEQPFSIRYKGSDDNITFYTETLNAYSYSVPGILASMFSEPYYFVAHSNMTLTVDNSGPDYWPDFKLYDMATEQVVAQTGQAGEISISAGYYKLVPGAFPINVVLGVNYYSDAQNSFSDISYNFYNALSQLEASISPEGVKKLLNGGINNYATKSALPFTTLYEYNVQGRLISVTDPDAGKSEFVYRKDGKIRFSQSAKQQQTGSYSYTNYDEFGRPVESGEYDGSAIGFTADMSISSGMKNIVESTSAGGGLTSGTKRDVIITQYDAVDNSHGLTGYNQEEFFLRGAVSVSKKYSSIVNNSPNSANLISSTWYNYDSEGKAIWMVQYIAGLGYKTTDYTYDATGNLVKKVYQKNTSSETFVHYYEYDPANLQLWKTYTNTTDNDATKQLQATYVYYLHGPLKRVELAGNLQGIDYTYTIDGKLKAINNNDKTKDPGGDGSNSFITDAFGMVLDYYNNDYVNSRSGIQPIKGVNTSSITTDSYAGNIKAMSWYSKKPSLPGLNDNPVAYIYKYNDKYQFIESRWGTGLNFNNTPATFTDAGANIEAITALTGTGSGYDANGNIKGLQRTDGDGEQTDEMAYNYYANTNKLQSVDNWAQGETTSYSYDAVGQVTATTSNTDPNTNKYLKYDVTGKVILVARDANYTQKVAEFVYNEAGQRVVKKSYNTSGSLATVTYYVNDVIYTQDVLNGGSPIAQEYEVDGGGSRIGVYYKQSNVNVYAYELNDHLGNVRAVIARSGSNSYDVRMYSDYYPFGMVIKQGGTEYRHGYQGKYAEKDNETDWNAFELRMYDSRIARWLAPDPYGQYASPYVAMGNDPANSVDPDGGFSTWARAQIYAFLWGGKVTRNTTTEGRHKGEWGVSRHGGSSDDGVGAKTIVTYQDKHTYKWMTTVAFKASVGVQLGVKGNLGPAEGKIEGGIFTHDFYSFQYDLARRKVTENNLAVDSREHNYYNVEGGLKRTNVEIGIKGDYNYDTYNGYNGTQIIEGTERFDRSGSFLTYKFASKKIIGDKVSISLKEKLAAQTVHDKKFLGVELGSSLKVIVGGDFKLKFGFEAE